MICNETITDSAAGGRGMAAAIAIKQCVSCRHWLKQAGRAQAPGNCLHVDAPHPRFRTVASDVCKISQKRGFDAAHYLTQAQCYPRLIVITPLGALAEVTAKVGNFSVALNYLFADEQSNEIAASRLREYVGPNIKFPNAWAHAYE